jgi:thioesterase domain-containing protein
LLVWRTVETSLDKIDMNNETKPVETKPEVIAGAQAGVETTTKAPESEVDFLTAFDTALKERDKAIESANNWKRVGLAKKRGEVEPDNTLTEEEVERRAEERAAQIVAQREADAKARQAEEIARKAIKENQELRIALKNKSGVVTTASTSSTGTVEVKQNPTGWTEAQLAHLKKMNVDPVKAWENYLKVKP